MPMQRLRQFLDDHTVPYLVVVHSPAFTAQQIAASAHVPGAEMAKSVIAKIDGKLCMVVLPASWQIDFDLLRRETRAEQAELAEEREFASLFPGCELGAMPPFGNLFGMEVFADVHLTRDREIVFNAGSHAELVRMSWADYERLVRPKIVDLAAREPVRG